MAQGGAALNVKIHPNGVIGQETNALCRVQDLAFQERDSWAKDENFNPVRGILNRPFWGDNALRATHLYPGHCR